MLVLIVYFLLFKEFLLLLLLSVFFFSSRRRHTRYWRDWSSDVCSSDLPSAKKNATSRAAVSGESEAWIAFRSLDAPYSLRTLPGFASAGSVAPMTSRKWATALSRSSASTSAGPEVMNVTSGR